MFTRIIAIIALLLNFIFILMYIINISYANKDRKSKEIYLEIKNIEFDYINYFTEKDKYPYLKNRIENLSNIVKSHYSFPYERVRLGNSLKNIVHDYDKVSVEREEIQKAGLPDLYTRIAILNEKISRVYFPFKHLKTNLTIKILLYLVLPISIVILKILNKFLRNYNNSKKVKKMKNFNDTDSYIPTNMAL